MRIYIVKTVNGIKVNNIYIVLCIAIHIVYDSHVKWSCLESDFTTTNVHTY